MDFYALTSQEILERISRHCPEAMSTYIQCLNRHKHGFPVVFTMEMVSVDMSESWTKFKRNIKKLALENLLEWHPSGRGASCAITVRMLDDSDV